MNRNLLRPGEESESPPGHELPGATLPWALTRITPPAEDRDSGQPPGRRPRTRCCLLKGCERRFRPQGARQRYCSDPGAVRIDPRRLEQCSEGARNLWRSCRPTNRAITSAATPTASPSILGTRRDFIQHLSLRPVFYASALANSGFVIVRALRRASVAPEKGVSSQPECSL